MFVEVLAVYHDPLTFVLRLFCLRRLRDALRGLQDLEAGNLQGGIGSLGVLSKAKPIL
jgi:hypothetical protein